MHKLADACVSGVGCHHFTGHQGSFIVVLLAGMALFGLLSAWFKSKK